MQVTAAQGGSTANGMLLRIFVLTSAQAAASQTGNSANAQIAASTAFTASITNSASSNIYGAGEVKTQPITATGSNATVVDSVADATNTRTYVTFHATGLSAGTATRGFTSNVSTNGPLALLEILASGTIAEDGSAPAVASTTAASTVTTVSFTPPSGSLLVAVVSSNGGAAVATMTVSGGGLTWAEKVKNDPSGGNYAGVWIADNPPTQGTVQPRATVPVPRRYPARAVTAHARGLPAIGRARAGWLIIRRHPSGAFFGGIASTVTGAQSVPGTTPGWVIIRRIPSAAFFGGYQAFTNVAPAPPVTGAGVPRPADSDRPWLKRRRVKWYRHGPPLDSWYGAEIPAGVGSAYVAGWGLEAFAGADEAIAAVEAAEPVSAEIPDASGFPDRRVRRRAGLGERLRGSNRAGRPVWTRNPVVPAAGDPFDLERSSRLIDSYRLPRPAWRGTREYPLPVVQRRQ